MTMYDPKLFYDADELKAAATFSYWWGCACGIVGTLIAELFLFFVIIPATYL